MVKFRTYVSWLVRQSMLKVDAVLPVKTMLARIMENVLITTMCTSVIAARLHIMVTFVRKVNCVGEE